MLGAQGDEGGIVRVDGLGCAGDRAVGQAVVAVVAAQVDRAFRAVGEAAERAGEGADQGLAADDEGGLGDEFAE